MTAQPGTCFKFTVSTAEEAAALIRERLGPDARVLSVRNVDQSGLSRLWSKPKLEVIAQIGEAAAAPEFAEEDGDELELPDYTGPVRLPGPERLPARPSFDSAQGLREVALHPPTRLPLRRTVDLSTLLKRSGLSDLALGRLQSSSFWPEVESAPLHRALVDIGHNIQKQAEARWKGAPLRRAAFFGSPGCGRTTALCKWIGREVFRHARTGHVVTVEFDRPNPTGTLPVFCEALGVPVARFPAATEPVVPGGFVYFDVPGISLRDPSANRPIAQFLDTEKIVDRVLVLNAAYDHAALRSAYAAARDLGGTHVVFTHLDEVTQWGRLWDYLLDGALEPLFLSTGPSLTGDCERDVFGGLVRRTLAADEAAPDVAPAHPVPTLAYRA
jgi:flagellar biosynthesis protein FlhF